MAKVKNTGDQYWEAETAINNAYAEMARKQMESKKSGSSASKNTNSKKK